MPTGPALATAAVAPSSVGDWNSRTWVDVYFSSPPSVASSHQYAIALSKTSPTGYYTWGTYGDLYAGGRVVINDGAGWYFPGASFDAAFRTYVSPPDAAVEFLEPLAQSTPDGTIISTAKSGRVIPVNVRLTQGGVPITDANAPGPITIQVTGIGACDAQTETDLVEVYAAGSSSSGIAFRYDPETQTWVYNLSTKEMGLISGNCYRIDVVVNGIRAADAWAILKPVR